jgi:Fe2+ transport system protein FeoA
MTARVSGCRTEVQEATAKRLVSLGILHGDQLESASLCPTILPGMDNLGRW